MDNNSGSVKDLAPHVSPYLVNALAYLCAMRYHRDVSTLVFVDIVSSAPLLFFPISVKEFSNSEMTTAMWSIVDRGDLAELSNAIDSDPDLVYLRR